MVSWAIIIGKHERDKALQRISNGNRKGKQYLDSEIEFVQSQLPPDSIALEMGAGYGRVMKRLSPSVNSYMDLIFRKLRGIWAEVSSTVYQLHA